MIGRSAVIVVAAGLVVGACDASDDGRLADTAPAAPSTPDSEAPDPRAPDPGFTEVTSPSPSTVPRPGQAPDGPLAAVCPERLVVQLDDVPSVEHGALYQLLGDTPAIDETAQTVSAPIERVDGTLDDVTLEIRSGGPVVDFRSPLEVIAVDPSVTFAVASTADVVSAAAAGDDVDPVSVMSLTDRSHDAVLWDPGSHPGIGDLESLAAAGVEIRHAPGERFIEFLAAGDGPLVGASLVDSYLGEPAAFVAAGGAIAQQADALTDPFLFENLPQWGRPVALAYAADSGWASYDDTLVVRSGDTADLGECLERFVPVVQEATVAYLGDPSTVHQLMSFVRAGFNPLTRASIESLDRGVADGTSQGLLGAAEGAIVGAFDAERLSDFLVDYTDALGLGTVTLDAVVDGSFLADVTM